VNNRIVVRMGAVAATAALLLLIGGPALAADPVAQGSATALTVGVAGQGTDTGKYTVVNDGTGEQASGNNSPALPVLSGATLANVGTLAQDATTAVSGGQGSAAACSGIAGEGATLTQVGTGTSCLTGGRTITLDAGHVDFSKVQLLPAEITQGIDTQIAQQLSGLVTPIVTQVLDALGDPGLYADLGAVQSVCTADDTGAQGFASIANSAIYAQVPGVGRVDLVSLPVNPAPNTHVVTDLSRVVDALQTGIDTQLDTALGGSSGPLAALTDPLGLGLDTVLDQVKTNLTDVLGPQLKPLQDNVLDIVLNKQTTPAPNSIEVTALDLSLLPAARQFIDADLVGLTIGTSACGPNSRVAAAAPSTSSTPEPAVHTTPRQSVPTAVRSGAASLESAPSPLALGGLAALVLAGVAAGVWGFRRSLR